MKVLPAGYERRRRDLYGRTRRFLYGLLLLAAAPGAVAADELSYLGQYRALAPAAAPAHVVLATLQGLVMIHAERAAGPAVAAGAPHPPPRVALDTVTARLQDPADAPLFRVAVSDRRDVPGGVSWDLAVPDFGDFHLDLHARPNARAAGRRWAVKPGGGQHRGQACTLGGRLLLVRAPGGERHVTFVPEVVLELAEAGTYLPFQASLKRASEEHVPQLAFEWRL